MSPLSRRTLILAALQRPLVMGGVRFQVEKKGRGKRRYLHIHGNEVTAREVLREHLKKHAGVYYFVESEKRNVQVGECLIDPNRMFTAAGARKSLERWNREAGAGVIEAAEGLLNRDREAFLRAVIPPKGGLLIAMHNNSEGYSMRDEVGISDAVHEPDPENPRDFLLVTDAGDFARIRQGKFNAVLQSQVKTDDGSFSVVAATRGVRYVNSEAALGNLAKQRAMLDFLEQVLPQG